MFGASHVATGVSLLVDSSPALAEKRNISSSSSGSRAITLSDVISPGPSSVGFAVKLSITGLRFGMGGLSIVILTCAEFALIAPSESFTFNEAVNLPGREY